VHDPPAPEGRPLSDAGLRATPQGTLVDRALRVLEDGEADSLTLARDVLGLHRANRGVADRVATALLGADPRVRRTADGRWALAAAGSTAVRLADCTFAVVDVETTGSRPARTDRITEVAVVALSNGRTDVILDTLVNPGRPVPRFVSALTRITDDMVRDRPSFADLADQVLDALAGRVFAAHNARFDWAFLVHEVRRARHLALDGPRICTVQLARRLVSGLRSRSLDNVARYFGIEITDRHRALGDALATAGVLQRLLGLAEERGVVTLRDLQELGRPRPRRRKKKTSRPTPMSET
jgi:DNA polymerase III epsilon subunit family exonuclease